MTTNQNTQPNNELPEEQRIKKVRDERSNRLNKPPYQKFRKLYRFADSEFEHYPEKGKELRKMIAEIEATEAGEIQKAVEEERNSWLNQKANEHDQRIREDERKRTLNLIVDSLEAVGIKPDRDSALKKIESLSSNPNKEVNQLLDIRPLVVYTRGITTKQRPTGRP
jgi:hypothetical protein